MRYPTWREVREADHEQLARWYRFLPSPAAQYVGGDPAVFERMLEKEVYILRYICDRFDDMGGFTPELSKKIGWE